MGARARVSHTRESSRRAQCCPRRGCRSCQSFGMMRRMQHQHTPSLTADRTAPTRAPRPSAFAHPAYRRAHPDITAAATKAQVLTERSLLPVARDIGAVVLEAHRGRGIGARHRTFHVND